MAVTISVKNVVDMGIQRSRLLDLGVLNQSEDNYRNPEYDAVFSITVTYSMHMSVAKETIPVHVILIYITAILAK